MGRSPTLSSVKFSIKFPDAAKKFRMRFYCTFPGIPITPLLIGIRNGFKGGDCGPEIHIVLAEGAISIYFS